MPRAGGLIMVAAAYWSVYLRKEIDQTGWFALVRIGQIGRWGSFLRWQRA